MGQGFGGLVQVAGFQGLLAFLQVRLGELALGLQHGSGLTVRLQHLQLGFGLGQLASGQVRLELLLGTGRRCHCGRRWCGRGGLLTVTLAANGQQGQRGQGNAA
ncbi:hypothetical protein Pstr01_02480 [Pseudomonas straminea]|nr:hypothetical protein Pstr01_02480 [Pseudomonas straminea]